MNKQNICAQIPQGSRLFGALHQVKGLAISAATKSRSTSAASALGSISDAA